MTFTCSVIDSQALYSCSVKLQFSVLLHELLSSFYKHLHVAAVKSMSDV